MRKLAYLLPVVFISACSVIDQPYLPSDASYSNAPQQAQGQYGGCASGACASGQSYSVAANGGAQNGAYQNSQYQNGQYQNAQSYGAPVYVNPPGLRGPSFGGVNQGGAYAAGLGAPALRGLGGRAKQGGLYGTLGGVLYDTDLDSYGLEGRIGYDSGRVFGAELEGSVGLINENDSLVDGSTIIDSSAGFDYNVAAFAVARYPVTQRLSLHARAGYDFRSLSVEAVDSHGGSAKGELDLDGFAYGFGGQYLFTPRDGIRIDLTSYDNEYGASESVSASYVRKF